MVRQDKQIQDSLVHRNLSVTGRQINDYFPANLLFSEFNFSVAERDFLAGALELVGNWVRSEKKAKEIACKQ